MTSAGEAAPAVLWATAATAAARVVDAEAVAEAVVAVVHGGLETTSCLVVALGERTFVVDSVAVIEMVVDGGDDGEAQLAVAVGGRRRGDANLQVQLRAWMGMYYDHPVG